MTISATMRDRGDPIVIQKI